MKKKLVKGETIILDYKDFRDTRFEECEMIYRGGRPPNLIGNDFINCSWSFENEAANTAAFLKALYSGGAAELVLETIGAKNG